MVGVEVEAEEFEEEEEEDDAMDEWEDSLEGPGEERWYSCDLFEPIAVLRADCRGVIAAVEGSSRPLAILRDSSEGSEANGSENRTFKEEIEGVMSVVDLVRV
ncbi:hypothetical protein FRC14_005938 [Serendipita sp. 396]|nr:hypothetical protein FRC14_005938 [Serendipita sp. 396]